MLGVQQGTSEKGAAGQKEGKSCTSVPPQEHGDKGQKATSIPCQQ